MTNSAQRRLDEETHTVNLALPGLMRGLSDALNAAIGPGRHHVLLIVHAGGRVQYAGTTPRPRAAQIMRDLLNRLRAGMPEVADIDPDDHRWTVREPARLLVEQLESAIAAGDPSLVTSCRQHLLDFCAIGDGAPGGTA